jgi:hypothetical protein
MASDLEVGQNRATLQSIKDTHNTAADTAVANRRRSGFRKGTLSKNGDGTTTVFTQAHGLVDLNGTAKTPTGYNFDASNAVSAAAHFTTVTSTNIVVTYTAAPASGTGNVQGSWQVWA